jgi:hypothetical protein
MRKRRRTFLFSDKTVKGVIFSNLQNTLPAYIISSFLLFEDQNVTFFYFLEIWTIFSIFSLKSCFDLDPDPDLYYLSFGQFKLRFRAAFGGELK